VTLRIIFDDKQTGRKFKFGTQRFAVTAGRAAARSMQELRRLFLREGRADIRAGGNFGRRWTQGLHADIEPGDDELLLQIYHDVPYFRIFEYGGVIKGRPLLWIPLSFAKLPAGQTGAAGYPGGLFRVDRKSGGAPLLLSVRDGKPKFFGKRSVTMPKKFHIREIARNLSYQLRDIYRRFFNAERPK